MTIKGRPLVQRITPPKIPTSAVRPVSNFYTPKKRPVVSQGMKELTQALGNFVPTLREVARTDDEIEKFQEGKKALAAFEENKLAIGEAIKKGLIPEGASPYFVKKYVELDLQDKVTKFKNKLFFEYGEQKVQNNTDPNAFTAFFDQTLNDFKSDEKLGGYNIVDLDAYFLNGVTAVRNNLEQQHINGRITTMENNAKLTLKQNVFNKINDIRLLTFDEIKETFDITDIAPKDIKNSYIAGELQKLADSAVSSNYNKTDVNNIIYDAISQAAIQARDPELLKILDFIEMGTGGFMSNTQEGKKVIQDAKDEIIAKQNYDITTYNNQQSYLNNRKLEILDQGFLKMIEDNNGIENVTIDMIDRYLENEFSTPEGNELTITPKDYERLYKFYDGFLATQSVERNKPSVVANLRKLIYANPNDPNIPDLILDNAKDGNLVNSTVTELLNLIPVAKEARKHPYLNSEEFDDTLQLVDDIVSNFRTYAGEKGVVPFKINRIQTKLRAYASNLLFDPKYYGGQNPYAMDASQRKLNFTLTVDTFNKLVEDELFLLLGRIDESFAKQAKEISQKLGTLDVFNQ